MRLLLVVVLLVQHLLHCLDVINRVLEGVHLRHLLGLGGRRDVAPQDLEAAVDLLHAVPLPRVSPGHLRRNCRRDGVAQRRVERDATSTRRRRRCRRPVARSAGHQLGSRRPRCLVAVPEPVFRCDRFVLLLVHLAVVGRAVGRDDHVTDASDVTPSAKNCSNFFHKTFI